MPGATSFANIHRRKNLRVNARSAPARVTDIIVGQTTTGVREKFSGPLHQPLTS